MKSNCRFTGLIIIYIVSVLFLPAASLWAEPLDTDCPAGAAFGQPPHYPEDESFAQDSDAGSTYNPGIIYDKFSGVANVSGIHFWGFTGYIDYGYYSCTEDPMIFEICFYIDSLNRPGHEVACYTQPIPSTSTGIIYFGSDILKEFETNLPTVELTEGWVSIEGQGGSNTCWFFWLSSRDGLDSYSIKDGDGTTHYPVDFAFCLFEDVPSCCTGITGNVNCSEPDDPDISDITRLIDFLYLSREPLCCVEEADVNASGGDPDISDVTRLIDFLYLSRAALPDCP